MQEKIYLNFCLLISFNMIAERSRVLRLDVLIRYCIGDL